RILAGLGTGCETQTTGFVIPVRWKHWPQDLPCQECVWLRLVDA
ncbi:uncharacterized protein METZ01_LOCUS13444, partial [marine metagenome]